LLHKLRLRPWQTIGLDGLAAARFTSAKSTWCTQGLSGGQLSSWSGHLKERSCGGKAQALPIHPNLRDVLDAIPDLEERAFVVLTAWGKPFRPKALGMRM